MQVIILPSAHDVSLYAADRVADVINSKTNPVLGLATGSTPIALYKELVARCQSEQVSFCQTISFNLDEYIGIADSHAQSYRTFMNQHLFDHIDIVRSNTHVPLAESQDIDVLKDSAQDYENSIQQAGGIDLQILGIGVNGHIGFNEPTSSFASRTRIKTLSESTVVANQRFFKENEYQPHLALTMGIGTILESRAVLLMATGKAKAEAVKAMIEGPLSAMCPASALQLHKTATLVLDEEAASVLVLKEYYQWCEQKRQQLQEGRLI
ncbi:glucosamine-6-phosphate deaminase [Marinomonas sp. M1K-6]|uniref:Glucosamine-6-phosphate deaminase n=1 Tax=Marinomonas profundi TaxID=2726122 RepID=A0A847QWT1_9GAMM|nr:glucosamine-6-phosphate deaminase [Marinomonas profundi]NLQ17918.1 glucosamine-6-phosphate deaminase [Marinomonas profundi]UDV03427.1 glucosamine-6-phosphate deaminase [Marinomonas profundi]